MGEIYYPDLVKEHIDAFVRVFIQKPYRSRWSYILNSPPRRWISIDATVFRDSRKSVSRYCFAWKKDLSALFADRRINQSLDDELVVLLRLGHDSHPGASVLKLREALEQIQDSLEGIISIIPGKLAVVYDHDDNLTVCSTIF
jgi:hypothetical protein